ncbi:MAG: hypothetical protein JO345_21925 [Streptosporangiaceae bacterium]|nr:hypothetical protein [Streptosporangiaceae bacterium]
MPLDSEIRQILVDGFDRLSDGLTDMRAVIRDHEDRLRKAEMTIARTLGGVGIIGFLLGLFGFILKH